MRIQACNEAADAVVLKAPGHQHPQSWLYANYMKPVSFEMVLPLDM